MRQLLPVVVSDIDPYEATRPEDPGARWLRLDMVVALDGRVTDPDGRSGGLGGPGDREIFRALRAHADAIIVGAGTARAEGYGPHRLRSDLAAQRAADGKDRPAPMVIVTRSAELDYDAALFTEAAVPTVVLTCESAPERLQKAAARAGQLIVAGADHVDLPAGLTRLRELLGARQLLCEGGPSLNAALLDASLVDEVCATMAPKLVGGSGPGLADGHGLQTDLDLVSLCEHDDELFGRWVLRATRPSP